MRISDWSSDVCSSYLHIGRLGVRRRVARIEAAALVDRDVDEHRAGAHGAEHLARDELRRFGAGDQDRADDRSEERRVGNEGVSPWRSRWSPYHSKKKTEIKTEMID